MITKEAAARLVQGGWQVSVALDPLDLGQVPEALHQRGLVRRLVPLARQQHALLRARVRLRASKRRTEGMRSYKLCWRAASCFWRGSSAPRSALACTCNGRTHTTYQASLASALLPVPPCASGTAAASQLRARLCLCTQSRQAAHSTQATQYMLAHRQRRQARCVVPLRQQHHDILHIRPQNCLVY